jgi:hypothetical protein
MFGSTGLFCIYSLPDGDIYTWDGVLANIEPGIDPPGPDEDDGKMDYLINVIVGGTGPYENATGILLGRTPGRGDAGNETGLPLSLIKIMEGYIKIEVKESKYSTALPSIGMAMNPQVWPEAWEALESGELVPMNMEMEAGSDFYEPRDVGFTIHSGIGWLEPFGRAEYVAGVGYPEAPAYRPILWMTQAGRTCSAVSGCFAYTNLTKRIAFTPSTVLWVTSSRWSTMTAKWTTL